MKFSPGLIAAAALATLLAGPTVAADALPEPTSGEFCQAVQRILASTDMSGTVEVFDNMPDYRSSKPAPDPLMIYQVVTYDEKRPVAVSCKVKSSDHLRATYGEDAAGEQLRCATIANMVRDQAVRELEAEYPAEAGSAGPRVHHRRQRSLHDRAELPGGLRTELP